MGAPMPSVEKRPVIPILNRKALLEHNPAPADVIEQAMKVKEAALVDLGVRCPVIGSWPYAKAYHHIPTTAIATAAVAASGDGQIILMYNPDFFVKLGVDGAIFVLFHEAYHLILRHLYTEGELRSDELFRLANEVTINHVALVRLKRAGQMPTVEHLDEVSGQLVRKPTGIDPREIFAEYEKDLTEQKLTPVSFDEFVRTDMDCYSEMKRMKNPPNQSEPSYVVCLHSGDGAGESDGQSGQVPMDQETVDRVVGEVLAEGMKSALKGNVKAKEDMLALVDQTDGTTDRIGKMWGNLGASALRGKTQKTRKVEWWKQYLTEVLGSLLRDGGRLIYPRKRGALLSVLGFDPMLAHRGRIRTKRIVIAIDTSGSMAKPVLDWLSDLVGGIPGAEVVWMWFDGSASLFDPGEDILGGGGTNFGCVQHLVEGGSLEDGTSIETPIDAVIMCTDGYAAPISPADPDKWIWLITEGGDDWPARANPAMPCHKVTTGDR